MCQLGIYRVAAAVPELQLANPEANSKAILELYKKCAADGASAVIFPELSLTGFSCGDFFTNSTLLEAAMDALRMLRDATKGCGTVMIIGTPLKAGNRLFNCAAVLQNGKIAGFTGKTFLGGSFTESRYFRSISEHDGSPVDFDGESVPLSSQLLYTAGKDFTFGVEIGDDLRSPVPSSVNMVLNGAAAIFNLSASPALAGAAEHRKLLATAQSSRLSCLYLMTGAGVHESTDSVLFSGHSLIAEKGKVLAESRYLTRNEYFITADFITRWLNSASFSGFPAEPVQRITLCPVPQASSAERLALRQLPFIPEGPREREERCREILEIQANALAGRVEAARAKRLVLGISGGLDSTLALLVCSRCRQLLGKAPDFILAVTMPGMGTTGRTRNNAVSMAQALGAELMEIDIRPAVLQHFSDIGHDPNQTNLVYENAQARERTQILMDLANKTGGLLVGTGDLSEIALGWSTFNGDHMSMYCVNADVPKTLIREMVEWAARNSSPEMAELLRDVNSTPVSPELLPGQQHTESIIGNYDLHDFFLYHFLKHRESPGNILALACQAFQSTHSPDKIRDTLRIFVKRFITQQFKRNVMPDGPKIGSIALSSKGDWQAPSEAALQPWIDSLDKYTPLQ